MTSQTPKRRIIPKELRFILSVGLVFFIFEYFVVPQLTTASKSLRVLVHINPFLAGLAIFLEIFSIWAYAELTKVVLTPHSPRRRDILRVNLSSLALGHILPGGTATAGALNYRLYSNLGVPASTNGFGLAVQGSGSAVVLNVIFWVALVVSIPLRGFNPAYGFAALADSWAKIRRNCSSTHSRAHSSTRSRSHYHHARIRRRTNQHAAAHS